MYHVNFRLSWIVLQTFQIMKMMVVISLLRSLTVCFDDAYPQYTHRNSYDDDEKYEDGQQEPGDLIKYINGIYMYGGYVGGFGG